MIVNNNCYKALLFWTQLIHCPIAENLLIYVSFTILLTVVLNCENFVNPT